MKKKKSNFRHFSGKRKKKGEMKEGRKERKKKRDKRKKKERKKKEMKKMQITWSFLNSNK
jgi:hypothetical protein